MKKKIIIISTIIIIIIILLTTIYKHNKKIDNINLIENNTIEDTRLYLEGLVIYKDSNITYVINSNQVIYSFSNIDVNIDDYVKIYYENELSYDNNNYIENTNNILEIEKMDKEFHLDTGYTKYQDLALDKVNNMSLDELVGQLYMVHHTQNSLNDVSEYYLGGFVFFGSDFKNKDKEDVLEMVNSLNNNATIPLLFAVDEEGGSIVRISSNTKLSSKRFSSPRNLYEEGGFSLIEEDTLEKIALLKSLNININLAPVLDMSNNKNDYIYARSIGLNSTLTGEYAKTVISASLGSGVSFVMKHFPGYASNSDTHKSSSLDSRSLDEVLDGLIPFQMGIDAKGEAIMVSHNTVEAVDKDNPVSVSIKWHNYLRNDMNFKGMIITDALNMGATKDIENMGLKSVLAGNDILVTKNYVRDINNIKENIENSNLSSKYIKELAIKVIEWKYYKGLL